MLSNIRKRFYKHQIKISYIYFVGFMIILVLVLISVKSQINEELKVSYNYLVKLEKCNTSVQQLVKNQVFNDDTIYNINQEINDLFPNEISIKQSNNLIEDWNQLKLLLINQDADQSQINLISDNYFYNSNLLHTIIQEDINEAFKNIYLFNEFIVLLSVITGMLISDIIGKMILQINILNALGGFSELDISSGVYNYRECKKVLKSRTFISNDVTNSMLVFSLKNIRKANDKCDKLVEVELISSFALILIQASQNLQFQPFIGRLKEKEFMVYFENSYGIDTINQYLEQINELKKQCSLNTGVYVIEYSHGFAINSIEKYYTVQQLLKIASNNLLDDLNNFSPPSKYKIQFHDQKLNPQDIFPDIEAELELKNEIRRLQIKNLKFVAILLIFIALLLLYNKVYQ